jgi:hypothetical protein
LSTPLNIYRTDDRLQATTIEKERVEVEGKKQRVEHHIERRISRKKERKKEKKNK